MVDLKQYSQRQITPTDDALFNDFILSGQSGIFEGCAVTSLGANQLNVSSGRGVILGRTFVITQEVILAQLATSGTMQGRLLLYVDMENTSTPIKFITQAADVLPNLTQEDINRGGRVFEFPLATYTVSNITISNLSPVISPVSSGVELARAAQAAANAAQSTANTAQSTATDAQGKAAAAQSTANTAVTKADTAQSTANSALTAANAAKSKLINTTLSTSWAGSAAPYTQAVSVAGMTATANGYFDITPSATEAQLKAFESARLVIYSQATNSVTLRAWGGKPTINIPVTFVIVG